MAIIRNKNKCGERCVGRTIKRTVIRVVSAAAVFLVLAIPRIDTQHPRQRSILGFSIHRVALIVLGALENRLTALVGVHDGPRGAQSP